MKKSLSIALLCSALSVNSFAQDTFKVMFYNLLNFPTQNVPPNRINYLAQILADYQPDIFMVCELNNQYGANLILSTIQENINPNFQMATFVNNTSDDNFGNQNDLQNLVFYNTSKFTLNTQSVVTTSVRDFNHYQLKLNTENQDTNPIFLDLVTCHLKASSGTENQNKRLQMVQALTGFLNTLPASSYVLLGGDLNLYRSTEPAFIELTNSTNNITFADPANRVGNWSNGDTYQDVFTQSTRTQTGMGGATGGFDDRFDFILTSTNMLDYSNNPELFYANNTYQVYGNNKNSNCYNNDINSSNCAEDNNPSTPDFSYAIRNALFHFSDHLPVTVQIQTTENFLAVDTFETQKIYEIIGTNMVTNTLVLQTNPEILIENKLIIYNTLGQKVKSISLNNLNKHYISVTDLANGLYYISTPNASIEPLKFIKVN